MVNITYPYVMIKLVGGFNPSEKYEFVSWDYYSQHMESHKIPWFHTTNQLWFIIFPLLLVYSLWKPLLTITINH